ncbi:MAG TPA: phosphoenolpyruvate synthase [Bdellovibrionales bacterium]|nr:MAG: phosphoenolpyruvate synthase [Bdellovibrionales bacterium GWB1_52_6]OFZ02796.1 MAG: phosphoenolpyruvate synthase [Bdellovibrionales bacterium GWA1_52_35]OFZ39786.1 MAG: phosphoenolpyruvate synthase [Bdellovibrionales bacterium GWC1_52_8]HAR42897.1 phosphoenolpyruvate synthase [Bdellovibrionales bacterium]HCM38378.1 phosphoenolpyruvate synthase [Bdellovibrionales bacterium]
MQYMNQDVAIPAILNQRLTLEAFSQLSGNLGGFPFVKVVIDRGKSANIATAVSASELTIHFLNNDRYKFHSDYIAEQILGISAEELDQNIDEFNKSVYLNQERRFYLGLVSLHTKEDRFFSLETVEIDNMDRDMLRFFFKTIKNFLDLDLAVLFKPANHLQENILSTMPATEIPRVYSHELFSTAQFVALNPGVARGRLRAFANEEEYKKQKATIEWHDIVVMHRVPDDIPRLSGIINANHTTPLSHTNVLASGWQIPNAIQIGIFERIEKEKLQDQWVMYGVDLNESMISLSKIEKPTAAAQRPAWSVQRVKLEEPETANTPIAELKDLRMSDRYRYGTKAANIGELRYILEKGSERILGFYKIKRPPRQNLLPYLASAIGQSETEELGSITRRANEYLRQVIQIPRGLALPFAIQQKFLESSPRIQQTIGKLKMALELNAREVDSLCVTLQTLIRGTRIPDAIRDAIDAQIANHLAGVSSFVVRSSSNAEDLDGFSAAGIYESINHVTSAQNIFESVKEVWASLVSPRCVRLRHEVGISTDDSYMGVIIQEEVKAALGGVLVTSNPMDRRDFRNVYINVSTQSVNQVVSGEVLPYQYLFNTVEGGGRTLSIGNAQQDLGAEQKGMLQKLALAGRLLQSHFSPDYTFSMPIDIEWLVNEEGIHILQLRPYSK